MRACPVLGQSVRPASLSRCLEEFCRVLRGVCSFRRPPSVEFSAAHCAPLRPVGIPTIASTRPALRRPAGDQPRPRPPLFRPAKRALFARSRCVRTAAFERELFIYFNEYFQVPAGKAGFRPSVHNTKRTQCARRHPTRRTLIRLDAVSRPAEHGGRHRIPPGGDRFYLVLTSSAWSWLTLLSCDWF